MVSGVRPGSGLDTEPTTGVGDIPTFKNIQKRDDFFNTNPNRLLLETDLPVVVNQGNAVTIFVWTGVDQPVSYDASLFIEQALNSGPGTLFLGLDGANLSSAGKTVNFSSAYSDTALAIGNFFTEKGSTKPVEFKFEKEQEFDTADVFDTQLSAPQDFTFTATISSYTQGFFVKPATSGTLTVKGFAGPTVNDPIILSQQFVIGVGDIGNLTPLLFNNGLLATPLDVQLLVFDGVDLFGGLQTSGLFNGQTKPFLRTKLHIIDPIHLLNENDLDQYVLLNHRHKTAVVKNGGIAVVTKPTATTDTFTNATFTAGVASTSNPTLITDGSATFAAGNVIAIEHGTDLLDSDGNDGLYEVSSHIGNVLTIKGVGTIPTTEDSVLNQFIFLESTGTITKVGVSVLRLTDSIVEVGFGNTTPFTFTPIGGGGALNGDGFDANDALYPASNPAVADSRNGHPIISFDDTVAENVLFNALMPANYNEVNSFIDIDWVAESAITGGVTWGIEIERNAPGDNDLDSDSFDAQQTGTSTTNGASGVITRTTITLTQAQADAIEALDSYRMRLQRVVGDVGDDMVGDAQVVRVGWRQ